MNKTYQCVGTVIGGLIGLVLAPMVGVFIGGHIGEVVSWVVPIASILAIVGGITVIILGTNRTKGIALLIGGLIILFLLDILFSKTALKPVYVGISLLFGLFGYILGKPIGAWAENKRLERQRLAEERLRREQVRREAKRQEQERREMERRRAEEERRRREEEERRRLEGMKQEILDKIDKVIKKD